MQVRDVQLGPEYPPSQLQVAEPARHTPAPPHVLPAATGQAQLIAAE